jgi:hypothetical protein
MLRHVDTTDLSELPNLRIKPTQSYFTQADYFAAVILRLTETIGHERYQQEARTAGLRTASIEHCPSKKTGANIANDLLALRTIEMLTAYLASSGKPRHGSRVGAEINRVTSAGDLNLQFFTRILFALNEDTTASREKEQFALDTVLGILTIVVENLQSSKSYIEKSQNSELDFSHNRLTSYQLGNNDHTDPEYDNFLRNRSLLFRKCRSDLHSKKPAVKVDIKVKGELYARFYVFILKTLRECPNYLKAANIIMQKTLEICFVGDRFTEFNLNQIFPDSNLEPLSPQQIESITRSLVSEPTDEQDISQISAGIKKDCQALFSLVSNIPQLPAHPSAKAGGYNSKEFKQKRALAAAQGNK